MCRRVCRFLIRLPISSCVVLLLLSIQRPTRPRPLQDQNTAVGSPQDVGLYNHMVMTCNCLSSGATPNPSSEMASSMMVSSAAAVSRTAPVQTTMVAPFSGLKSAASFPVTRKANADLTTLPSNGGRVQCIQVWPPEGVKKFETLSYLPPLSNESLAKEIDYLLSNGWVPCLEFSKVGFVYRENDKSPGYYDGRYWTMWKLPMFGCTDSAQVLAEIEECKKAYPDYFVRVIGFNNQKQVQCVSFIAYKPLANY